MSAARSVPAAHDAGGARPNLTLLVSALAVMAVFLDTTVLYVAYPDIVASFPAVSAAGLSWVLNAYTITFAALLIPAGKIADRLGHKRSLIFGSAIFTVASVACAAAPNPELLIGFRIVQAVGAAIQIPSSLALILRAFDTDRVPVAVAIWASMGAAAGAIGPSVGSGLVATVGWRWVFLLNVPVGIAIAVFGSLVLRESHDPASRLPAPFGIVLVAAAASLISLGMVQSNDWGISDGRTVAAVVGGMALFAVFIVHQLRTSAPTLDLELFAIRNFAWGNAATFVLGIGFSAMFFGSILFLTTAWDWSILKAGFGVAPGPLLVAILAPQAGRVAARVGQRALLVPGGLAFASGGLWRIAALGPEAHYWVDYFPSMLLTGLGVALLLPQLASVTAQSLPANRLGVGGATNQALRQLGGTFGVAFTVALLGTASASTDVIAAFDKIWILLIVSGLGAAALSVPLTRSATAEAGKEEAAAEAAG